MSVRRSNTASNRYRWLRILGTAAGACLVAAACGGGSIQGAGGPGQGLQDLNETNLESEYGSGSGQDDINRTIEVTKETKAGEERIYFRAEGRETPILWAKLQDQDKLMFTYKGKRYTYEVANHKDTLEPDGGAGQILVGGEMAPGAKVGLAVLEVGEDTSPYMVTILGKAAAEFEAESADYILARCGAAACEDNPSGGEEYTVRANTKKIIETVLLATNTVRDNGDVNWHLERRPRTQQSASDDEDGWGNTGNSSFDDKWDNLEPLPETLPGATSTQSSNNDDDGGGGLFTGLVGGISDLFSWDNLLIAGGVLAGGALLWDGLGWLSGGTWGGDKFFLGIGNDNPDDVIDKTVNWFGSDKTGAGGTNGGSSNGGSSGTLENGAEIDADAFQKGYLSGSSQSGGAASSDPEPWDWDPCEADGYWCTE